MHHLIIYKLYNSVSMFFSIFLQPPLIVCHYLPAAFRGQAVVGQVL